MAEMLIRFFVMKLLLTAPAITAELCSQMVNVTASNTVVVVSVGANISFQCDFGRDSVTSWILNEQPLSEKNGTLDITTDELFEDTAVSYLQCFSHGLATYNITAVLVTSELQVKLCNWAPSSCAFNSITPSLTNNLPSIMTASSAIPQPSPCLGTLCIVRTTPYIATAAIGGSAVLVVVCMMVVGVCSCCCRKIRRKNTRPSTIGTVVVNPLAWERPVELTPLDLSQSSFNFNTSPK